MKGGNHATSKFSPVSNSVYICKTLDKTSAWCNISYSCSMMLSKLDTFDLNKSRSLDEWRVTFSVWKSSGSKLVKDVLELTIKSLSSKNVQSQLKSPVQNFNVEKLGVEDSKTQQFIHMKSEFNILKPETSNLFRNIKSNETKSLLEAHHMDLGNLVKHASNNVQNWSTVKDLVDDVELISSYVSNLRQGLGSSNNSPFLSAWNAIDELWKVIDGVDFEDIASSVNQTSIDVIKLQELTEIGTGTL